MLMSDCDQTRRVGIAIVEDEKDLVKVYEKIFSKRNIFICFVAYDGLEAVKKFIECTPKPHVVLMDYRLPIMNGVEATKEILKIDPYTKIVFLSADVSVRDEAMRVGACIFLKKPASIKDILGAMESAIGIKLLPKQA
jgi:DNA-binding NtrC family response regulator